MPRGVSIAAPRPRLAAVLLALGLLLLTVALAAAFGHRLGFDLAFVHVSIRNPRNPACLAVATLALAASIDRREGFREIARGEQWLRRLALPVAIVLAIGVGWLSYVHGTFVAGGADSSGYLSQARLFRTWTFARTEPLADRLEWPDEAAVFAPLGYRPSPVTSGHVPSYPPGLPAMFAAAHAVAGEPAVFVVVPLCAAAIVLLTFSIARTIADPTTGLVAAALIAASPILLFQAVQPMSDVPAAFWWTLAFALLLPERLAATVAAGTAAGLASLVRPNLWFLVAVTAATLVLWRTPMHRWQIARPVAFVVGALPPAIAFAAWNLALYGAVGETGYGTPSTILTVANVWPNGQRYLDWLLALQTPAVLLALAAPFVARRRGPAVAMLVTFGALLLFYLFYLVFDEWPFVRFLLPALPLLLVATAMVLVWGLVRLPLPVRLFATIALLVSTVLFGELRARERGVFLLAGGEARYREAALALAAATPAEAVVFTRLHSGSASYYTARTIARWDAVPPGSLRRYAADLFALGRPPYLLLDELEGREFEELHAGELADTPPPTVLVGTSERVLLYDLSPHTASTVAP